MAIFAPLSKFGSLRFKNIGREFVTILIGNISSVIATFVGIKLLTSSLTPSHYGELSLWITLSTFPYLTIIGPLNNGITRYFSASLSQNTNLEYIKASFMLFKKSCNLILLFFAIICLFLYLFGKISWFFPLLLIFFYSIFSGINTILNGIQHALRHRASVEFNRSILAWSKYVFAVFFIRVFGSSSLFAIFGYLTSSLLVILVQFIQSRVYLYYIWEPVSNARIHIKSWQQTIYTFSWPFATWGLLGWLRSSGDKWGLGLFTSTDDVGYYALLYQLGSYPIVMSVGLLTTTLAPIIYQRVGTGDDQTKLLTAFKTCNQITIYFLVLMSFVTLLSIFISNQLILLVSDKSYLPVAHLLPFIILASSIYEATRFYSVAFQAKNLSRELILPNNTCHMLGFVLVLLFAFLWGLNGVILAQVIQAIVSFVWHKSLFNFHYSSLCNDQ